MTAEAETVLVALVSSVKY